MKTLLVVSGIIVLMMCFGFARADFAMTSTVDCSGDCSVKQTYNGESVEVVSSGKTSMATNATNGKAEMAIDSTGQGEVRMNLNDGDSSNLKVIVNSDGSGNSGNNINTTFNSRENAPDEQIPYNFSRGNWSEDEANDSDSNYNGSSCSDYQMDDNCSAQENLGNTSQKKIEVNSDGIVEKTETDGIFQRVYQFFQSFSARIFWG